MSRETKTITPLYSFEICPSDDNGTRQWLPALFDSSKVKASCLDVHSTQNYKHENRDIKTPAYSISSGPPAVLPFWPFSSQPKLSIFDHEPAARGVKPRTITIERTLLERFMCSIGSVNYAPTPEASGSSAKAKPTPTEKDLQLTSGLGHGEWQDRILTKLLGRDESKPLQWCASPDQWEGYDKSYSGHFINLAWASRGKCAKGSLILKGDKDLLAIYKPRSSPWQYDGAEKPEKSDGVGSFGIMIEGVTGEALEHMILTCVAIEEQITRSKGFGGWYHADWSGQT